MCGMAGIIDFKSNIQEHNDYYNDMLYTLQGRGPDSDGIYLADNVLLMHAGLAVADIENGNQPMHFKQGENDTVIVYNGKIYNAEEIRSELLLKGYTFRGHSDIEVLLYSYVEWGEACVNKLNGIFAFAIWDGLKNRLFIARDKLGVKPFFYCYIDNKLIFSSEIKTLLKHPLVKSEIDTTSIAELILIGPGRTPGYGVFKNVQELKPAHVGFFSENGLSIYPYWKITAKKHKETFAETLEHVKFLIHDSIERQIVGDTPICSFLSGGLDSSVITALSGVRNTFSVDYEENDKYFKATKFQPNSDNEYIKIMSDFLGTKHTTFTITTDDLIESLFTSVRAKDFPGMADVDGSMLLFCRAVKEHAAVALSGECADELFGGYPWYRDEDIRMIDGFPWSRSTGYRASFIKDGLLKDIDPKQYVYKKYLDTVKNSSVLDDEPPLEKRMKEMFNLNIDWFMQTLLDRTDRMSMYSGLEVRVPFCDERIVEYVYNIPWEFKNYKDREKGILRTAMEGVLPDKVLWRKKSPYPKTHNPKYLKKVSDMLSDIITSPLSPILNILKKEQLENLLQSDISIPWYGQLMTTPQTIAYFIQLNYWLEHYKIIIV